MNAVEWFEGQFGDLLRVIGVILGAQGVISQYFVGLGVQPRILTAIFGGLGLVMMVAGKHIDSTSYTAIQVAAAAGLPITPSDVSGNALPPVAKGAL